ncbi:MAG TPA: helix-turn-helix transcriptional regulator [Longimicrobiaceae bacterium]|nr:helix-turn-helix transcriptional regulator [Longimicrobiaceae bacterium]
MIAQQVLGEAGVSLRQLAEDSGVNYGTLRVWAVGKRNPQPENLRQIAAGLRERGKRLDKLAEKLERAAGEEGDANA